MAILTKYGNTKIKCLDMPNTNNTLIVTNYNGVSIRFIIKGEQISKKIVTDKETKKKVYRTIKENYDFNQTFLN